MGTTTKWAIPYPAATDPADVPADMQRLAERVDAIVVGGPPAPSATPPGSPTDGQLWTVSPTAGTTWVFRYNAGSASAYKWEFIGGPPYRLESFASNTNGGTMNSYVNVVGSGIPLARAGEYVCEGSGTIIGSGSILFTAWGIFALAGAALAGATVPRGRTTLTGTAQGPFVIPPQLVTATAGQSLTIMGQANVANINWAEMGWQALPIRVA